MQGIHDLGGMDGFGLPDPDSDSVFSEEWEREVWGLLFSTAIPGVSTGGRRAIEAIPAAEYLNMPYYARWLYIQEQALLNSGIVTAEELANPDGPLNAPDLANDFDPPPPAAVVEFLAQDASSRLDIDASPRYSVGDAVRTRDVYPAGHTRMPRYVRGRQGVIARDHGIYPFEDDLPDRSAGRPQHVYSVRFTAAELWGPRAHPGDVIYADLWEDHLENVN